MNNELPTPHRSSGYFSALAVVGVFAIGFALFFRSAMEPIPSNQVGHEFPAIEAAGWINGPGPTKEDLQGKIIVVDAWAHWCGPCRAATPFMVELHEKYKDRGVIFLGLTTEGLSSESLRLSREFVKSEKVPWPNGYGAINTLAALAADSVPQFWIVDRENRIVLHEVGWGGMSLVNMDRALKKAIGN